jgi:cytochrome oxidase Cu insertion factor (SCO1/SenC/PrrC family)
MSGQPDAPVHRGRPGRVELIWRWAAYGVMPFAVALTTAMAVTAYVQARSQAGTSASAPAGSASAPTLAQMMNLSPLPERAAPGFTLTDQRGRRVSLSDFRGKTVLLAFLDSRCTEVCPVIAQELLAASRDLGPRAASVAFVGVNVDPAAESVAAVRNFSVARGLARLPYWYFLTGPTSQLARVWNTYGIEVELPPGASQTVHADYIFFINPLGYERFPAEPFADQRANGTGYLPAATIGQWGRGIARYLEQAAEG